MKSLLALVLLLCLNLVFFSSNSILCRGALVFAGMPPLWYTAVRGLSAACMLALLCLGGIVRPAPGSRAGIWKDVWQSVLPASWLGRLGDDTSWCLNALQRLVYHKLEKPGATDRAERWAQPVADALAALPRLASIPWRDGFAHRDAIDVARMVVDRLISLRADELGRDMAAWRRVEYSGSNLVAKAENLASLCDSLADILALHTDYSLWESYLRLDSIEKVRNPEFTKTLFENAANDYCLSHQYEIVRHWVVPSMRRVAKRIADAVAADDRRITLPKDFEELRCELKGKPLESLRPTLPRTREEFRRIIDELVKSSKKGTKQ